MEESKKMEYQSPELMEYGSIEELTQSDPGPTGDGDGASLAVM
jgi:hypothetical protein